MEIAGFLELIRNNEELFESLFVSSNEFTHEDIMAVTQFGDDTLSVLVNSTARPCLPAVSRYFSKFIQGMDHTGRSEFIVALSGSRVLPKKIVVVTEPDSECISFSTCMVEVTIPTGLVESDLDDNNDENYDLFKAAMEAEVGSNMNKVLFNTL